MSCPTTSLTAKIIAGVDDLDAAIPGGLGDLAGRGYREAVIFGGDQRREIGRGPRTHLGDQDDRRTPEADNDDACCDRGAGSKRHRVLSEVLRRIMRKEGRHTDFYAGQASAASQNHLGPSGSPRWALRHYWSPVGSDVLPAAGSDHLIRFLSAILTEGQWLLVSAAASYRLPGLQRLRLATTAVAA